MFVRYHGTQPTFSIYLHVDGAEQYVEAEHNQALEVSDRVGTLLLRRADFEIASPAESEAEVAAKAAAREQADFDAKVAAEAKSNADAEAKAAKFQAAKQAKG